MKFRLDDDPAAPPAWLAATVANLDRLLRRGHVTARDHRLAVRLLSCLEADGLREPLAYVHASGSLRLRWYGPDAVALVVLFAPARGTRFELYDAGGRAGEWYGGVLGLRNLLCNLYPDLRARWRGEDCGGGRADERRR